MGGGGGGSCEVSANEYNCIGAPINFGDLTPYLSYVVNPLQHYKNAIVTESNYCTTDKRECTKISSFHNIIKRE
jgi:hypothetical protein